MRLTDELRNERTRNHRGNTVFVKYYNSKFKTREKCFTFTCFEKCCIKLFFNLSYTFIKLRPCNLEDFSGQKKNNGKRILKLILTHRSRFVSMFAHNL